MRRILGWVTAASVGIGCAALLFGWRGTPPEQAASSRLMARSAEVQVEAPERPSFVFERLQAKQLLEDAIHGTLRLQVDADHDRILDEAMRGCRHDKACIASVLYATAASTGDRRLSSRLEGTALALARSSEDEALWQDLLIARGTGRRERDLERRVAQGWGRFLAARAPGLQQKAVKAAVLVTPDSPLHEPLAWLGGYPACDIDRARGWVACAPQGR